MKSKSFCSVRFAVRRQWPRLSITKPMPAAKPAREPLPRGRPCANSKYCRKAGHPSATGELSCDFVDGHSALAQKTPGPAALTHRPKIEIIDQAQSAQRKYGSAARQLQYNFPRCPPSAERLRWLSRPAPAKNAGHQKCVHEAVNRFFDDEAPGHALPNPVTQGSKAKR